jgi:hypothetical protein
MSPSTETLIGHVVDVCADGLTINLLADEQGMVPKITVGDEDILVGQLGAYVSVRQTGTDILCVVTRMTEQERIADPASTAASSLPAITYAQRIVLLVPIGSITAEGKFERGVSAYPTTGAEVHVISGPELDVLFSSYREQGYFVGNLSAQPNVRVCLEPSRLFGRHFAILGQTGSGKSWTVATLVQQALKVMPKAHIIILDLHGEYCWVKSDGVRDAAFKDENFRYVDARALEMPYWLMTYAELCDLLIDHTEREAANQTAFFRDTLFELKQAELKPLGLERVTVDTPVYFSLDALMAKVKAENERMVPGERGPKKGPMHGDFDRFLIRLQSKLNDVRYDFLLKPQVRTSSGTLSDLLRDFVGLGSPKRPVTVIDLSTVPFDVRPTVAAQIGRLAFEFNYWNPAYREFPILLICEEAHAYVRRDHDSQYAGARKSMERIAKEGRKYGVGLAVVSQRPHELSETVLAQCGTFLCLRITNPDDQSYIRSLVPEAERGLMEILAGLGRGECLALGEAVPLPTRFKFIRPAPAPNSEDINYYKQWKEGPEDIDVENIVNRWRRQQR